LFLCLYSGQQPAATWHQEQNAARRELYQWQFLGGESSAFFHPLCFFVRIFLLFYLCTSGVQGRFESPSLDGL
jgi:hypothetical protein